MLGVYVFWSRGKCCTLFALAPLMLTSALSECNKPFAFGSHPRRLARELLFLTTRAISDVATKKILLMTGQNHQNVYKFEISSLIGNGVMGLNGPPKMF